MQKVKKIAGSTTSFLLGLCFLVIFFVFYGVAYAGLYDVGGWILGMFTNRTLPSNANTAGHWTNDAKQTLMKGCMQQYTQTYCTCITNYVSQHFSTVQADQYSESKPFPESTREEVAKLCTQ